MDELINSTMFSMKLAHIGLKKKITAIIIVAVIIEKTSTIRYIHIYIYIYATECGEY